MRLISLLTLVILLASCTVCCCWTLVNASVGEKVTLPCHTDLSSPVDWKYKQHDIDKDPDKGEYIFIGGNRGVYWPHHNRTELTVTAGDYNRTMYNLTLHNLTVRDTGTYTCIEDTGLGTKHPFWVNVRHSTRIVNATVGQKVTLSCHTKLRRSIDWKYKKYDIMMEETNIVISGKLSIYWKSYDRTELTSEPGDYNHTIYYLTLYNFTLCDTGVYTCIEDEGLGTRHPFWLRINVRRSKRIVNATVGQKVTLPCYTELRRSIDWKYKKYDIMMEETNIVVAGKLSIYWKSYDRTELTSAAGDYNLIIHNVTVSDTGVYSCVEDDELDIMHLFWLKVSHPVHGSKRIINATVGQKVTLSCHTKLRRSIDWKYKKYDIMMDETNIVIAGKLSIYWKHDDRTELTSEPGDYNHTIYYLTLHNFTLSDTGIYTCIEDEGLGTKHPFWLRVNVRHSKRIVNATVGQKVTLPCYTELNSSVDWKYKKYDIVMEETNIVIAGKLSIYWKSYDRTELTSAAGDYNLIIHNVTVNDTGAYSCVEDEELDIMHLFWLQVSHQDAATSYYSPGRSQIGVLAALIIAAVLVILVVGLRPTLPHVELLQKVYKDLTETLLANNVAVEMFARKALNLSEKDNIRSCKTESEAAEILLKIVMASKREVYDCFLDLLRSTGQKHLYKLIVCSDFDLDKRHCRLIQQNCMFLLEKLDTKTSLLVAHLRDADVLSPREREDIEAELTPTRQNEKLLSLLSRKSSAQWEMFLTALDNTGQRHITDHITGRPPRIPSAADVNKDVIFISTKNRVVTPIIGPQTAKVHRRKTNKQNRETRNRRSNAELLPALPMELLELVLMKTFMKLFTDHYKSHHKTHEAIQLSYRTLAAVCYNWWQTMNGWPQSTTKHWFKHKLLRAVTFVCRPYGVSPRLQSSLPMSGAVSGVTVCDNKLFVVYLDSNSILVFGPNNKQQTNIKLEQLEHPSDIVSCTETQQLFVSDESRDSRCVWRVSLDGRQVVKWLPNKSTTTTQFRPPWTLSVTSRRLLVTSYNELLLYGADGDELKRVPLPDTMTSLQHAVETSRGTFIVSHREPQPRVCEVNVDGHVTRVYCDQQQLSYPVYLSLDTDGRIFVADFSKHRILLLNSETLELERVLLDKQQHQLTQHPHRLCYTQQTQQLAVGSWVSDCVQLFTVY